MLAASGRRGRVRNRCRARSRTFERIAPDPLGEKLHRAKQAGSKALPKRVDAWLKTRTETHQERREAHGRCMPAPRTAFDRTRFPHQPVPHRPDAMLAAVGYPPLKNHSGGISGSVTS